MLVGYLDRDQTRDIYKEEEIRQVAGLGGWQHDEK